MTGRQAEFAGEDDLKAVLAQVAALVPPAAAARQPGAYTVGQNLYAHLRLCAYPLVLYHTWSQRQIGRYLYARSLAVPPFAGDYGRQPAWWLDAAQIIATELAACSGCQCAHCAGRKGLRHETQIYTH